MRTHTSIVTACVSGGASGGNAVGPHVAAEYFFSTLGSGFSFTVFALECCAVCLMVVGVWLGIAQSS